MVENVESPCIVADDNQTSGETMGKDAAGKRSFVGNFDLTWFANHRRTKMIIPFFAVTEFF
jgi:hypothetical protein